MIQFDLPKQKSSIIKVLGVGGGGSNAVNYMFADDIEGVDFIICNTDSKALDQSHVPNKIQLGPHLTQGLGAGANPEVGKQATEESLEEIRRILEVNTKMAFITVGMGGGTGTGGAPIIAQVCRELGILTVAIVTTPFGFEGPRRLQQAEEGIRKLQPFVDTLLVISNDKLRMQYGNLKMKEAFSKADNVLATAAKCITDIINSHGHIIVDFADVCTVMKNGGVAILGNSGVEGENRAQRAIEEALSSPLLNDNEIRGAKWILININSAEGEFECTMDEMEIINNYLRMQTGEKTDVIMGMGYDNSLDKKLGITLIATGFDQKDAFSYKEPMIAKPEPKAEKIVMTLGVEGEENKLFNQQSLPFIERELLIPTLVEVANAPVAMPEIIRQVLQQHTTENEKIKIEIEDDDDDRLEVLELHGFEEHVEVPVKEEMQVVQQEEIQEPVVKPVEKHAEENTATSGGYLYRPKKIYAEMPAVPASQKKEEVNQKQEKQEKKHKPKSKKEEVKEEFLELELIIKNEQLSEEDELPARKEYAKYSDEEEDQKKRAAERISKLRNLSFNMNSMDHNNEFENVPAYVRKNMDLFGGNKLTSVEDFYSKYAVKKEENEKTAQISTINTFLDGKKPD